MHRAVRLALVFPALLAACSSGPSSSTPSSRAAAPASACDLLSPAEVASAFGTAAASPGQRRGGAGWIVDQCEWASGDASVSVAVGSSGSLAAKGVTVPLATYVAQRRATEEAQFAARDATGVGDGGYVLTGRAPTALVYRGDVLVQLIAFSRRGPVEPEVTVALAALALGRAAG